MKKTRLSTVLALVLCAALGLASCGDYKPCEVMASRICNECPRVATHWQAACLCFENKTVKENGYKCLSPSAEDEVRCHAALEYWDEQTCDQLN